MPQGRGGLFVAVHALGWRSRPTHAATRAAAITARGSDANYLRPDGPTLIPEAAVAAKEQEPPPCPLANRNNRSPEAGKAEGSTGKRVGRRVSRASAELMLERGAAHPFRELEQAGAGAPVVLTNNTGAAVRKSRPRAGGRPAEPARSSWTGRGL